jgi:hypothetical protein
MFERSAGRKPRRAKNDAAVVVSRKRLVTPLSLAGEMIRSTSSPPIPLPR